MRNSIFRPIIFGALLGAAFFFIPFFLFHLFFFFLIAGMMFRFFGRGRRWGGHYMAYADKIRSMSDEEYAAFKTNYATHCRRPHRSWAPPQTGDNPASTSNVNV